MESSDLVREMKALYFPPKDAFVFADVPELSFLRVDGQGSPATSPEFQEAIAALYSLAYTVKFALKKERGLDTKVPPLEGLFWGDTDALPSHGSSPWNWTLMLVQPAYVTDDDVARAAESAGRKRPLPALRKVRLERFREGLCVQTLYVGAYAGEEPTIRRLHDFISEHGYVPRGKHHEIYLSDPRRTKPERLKTTIRQPVEPA